jgi:DNA-binding winged helix-turn-helix (wHTH) protein/Tol biopolymer transport system component
MGNQASANRRVRFGVFEFNPTSFELRRNGTKVKLQDQPGQILSALLEVPGDVVSREELRKRLWPVDTFVDFDHSLNTAIKRLRDTLGDSADNPIFIETLSRRGYRFMAPIDGHSNGYFNGNGSTAAQSVTPLATASKFSLRTALWALGGLVITTGAVSAGWHAGHSAMRPVQPREIRLTTNSADAPVDGGTISASGRMLAYADHRGTYVKDTTSGETHEVKLPEGFAVNWASWYPDEGHLLVSAVTDTKDKPGLWKISLLGGLPQKLVEDGEWGRVSPDGKQISFLRGEYIRREIWVMNVDGSEARKEVDAPGYFLGAPVWSPDSAMLAYQRVIYYPSWNDEDVNLETHALGSGKSQTVMTDREMGGGLAWLKDGRIVFTLAEGPPYQGDTNVWTIPVDAHTGTATGARTRITTGPDRKPVMDVSADGKKVLFLRTNIQPAIYTAEIDATTKTARQTEKLTLNDRTNLPYEWTPDGKSVLYISNREGKFHIYRQGTKEGTPEMLPTGEYEPRILRLNPERTEIIYLAEPPLRHEEVMQDADPNSSYREKRGGPARDENYPPSQLVRMQLSGGKGKVLLTHPAMNNFQCARAPARECIFSSFANDALEFYEFDAENGNSSLMFKIGDPEWQLYNWTLSPNGELLALAKKLRAQDEAELQILPVHGGSTRRIGVKDWRSINTIDWAADGKSIWASASPRAGEDLLVNIDLQGHVKLAMRGNNNVGWAIPSQDGKRLAIWEASGASNVWMLEGF